MSFYVSNLHIWILSLSFYYNLFLWTSYQHYLLSITQFIFLLFPSQYFPFVSLPYWSIFKNRFSYSQKVNPAVYTLELSLQNQSTGERNTKTFSTAILLFLPCKKSSRWQYCCLVIYTQSYWLLTCPTRLCGMPDGIQRDCSLHPKFNRLLLQEKCSVKNIFFKFTLQNEVLQVNAEFLNLNNME